MRKMKLLFLNLIFLLIFSHSGNTQIFPNLGGQRAGISALTFLKNDLAPRSSAMAGASVALPGDAFSMTVNPASASVCRNPVMAISSGSNATGLVQSFIGIAVPGKEAGVWMASLNYLSSGLQLRRTEFQPLGDGSQYASDAFKVGLGYSRSLSKMFSCGMNLNLVREQLSQYSATAVTADMGFLYKTDWKDLSFAVGLQHFGGNSTGKGDFLAVRYNRGAVNTEAYGAPTLFSMGVSISALHIEKHRLLAAAQLNHPNDNAENIRLGLHYCFDSLLHVRVGYKLNVVGEGLTAGLGIRSRIGAFPLTFDYAIVPNRYLGLYHSLGISVGFIKPGQ